MPRVCTICTHPNRQALDRALLAGEPYRDIARRFRTSKDALLRHKGEHLSARIAQAAERQADADVRTALDVVAELRLINSSAKDVLASAYEGRNPELILKAVDRIQKQVELQSRLLDLLSDGTTVNVVVSPEWAHLRSTIVAALRPHPEALKAVAAALQYVEGGSDGRGYAA